ncbi:MAG: hypothetical protein WA450_07480, partial [Candidatus Acidiferrales bacterium]
MTPAPGSRDSSAAAAAAAREDGHAAAEKENQVPGKMTDPHNRIISGKALDDDARIEASIRPTKLSDYIGQNRVKENLQIAVEAARTRG